MSDKAKVFVIMPFSDDFKESYELLKDHFENEYDFSHAGDEDNQQNILADIIPPIFDADVVLADLTGLNPNVMYELGIAHSLSKKTIIITRDELSKLPFDLKAYRVKDYSTHFKKFNELIQYLEKNLRGAVDGSVLFSNPVVDFLDKKSISAVKLFNEQKVSLDIADDKGFLDFLADIEEDTLGMNESINSMNTDMNTMSTGITSCTAEMERVKQTGGNGTASFIRKQAKKVAEYISTYSKQLKGHNERITRLWSKIEKNIAGLLENEHTHTEENKTALIEYLKSLSGLKKAIKGSNDSIRNMKQSSLNNLGLERTLNQSIRFLDADLASYLEMTEQMIASIDRILSKSRFVVGEIDFSQEEQDNA